MSQAAEVTDSQWESAVLESDVPVFVDFWAEWCAPCRAMGPYVDKLAQEYQGKLKVLKINTQDNPEVPSRYGITAIPTFLVIKKGEVDTLKDAMERSTQEGGQTFDQALFELYRDARIDAEQALANADSANNLRIKMKNLDLRQQSPGGRRLEPEKTGFRIQGLGDGGMRKF